MKPYYVVLLVIPFSTATADDDAVKKELAQLNGAWQVLSMEEDKQPGADYWKSVKFVFKGNELTFTGDAGLSKKVGKLSIVVDPSTTPKTIDFAITDGSEKGLKLEGIYELKGDELKVCVHSGPAANRPLEFATKENGNLVLFVLKREKSRK